jgi:prefoldin alpha subunit
MDGKELQEKAILYQLLAKHLENMTQNAIVIERRFEEIEAGRMALEDIGKMKEKNEIMIPLGSGIFTHGRITDPKRMLVDIGSGIFLEKDSEAARQVLEERKQEIEKMAGEMQREMSEVSGRINSLAMEIESASQQEHEDEHPGKGKGHSHE